MGSSRSVKSVRCLYVAFPDTTHSACSAFRSLTGASASYGGKRTTYEGDRDLDPPVIGQCLKTQRRVAPRSSCSDLFSEFR